MDDAIREAKQRREERILWAWGRIEDGLVPLVTLMSEQDIRTEFEALLKEVWHDYMDALSKPDD